MSSSAPFQIPLGVGLRDDARFENFYPGGNELALATARAASRGEGELLLYYWGASAVGCSHLLQAVCHAAEPAHRSAIYLPLDEMMAMGGPNVLEGLEHLDLVCLDNVQVIAGNEAWELGVFHFFNRIRAQNNHLLIGASVPPRLLGIKLPDLQSRLTWGMVFQLQPLGDEDKVSALKARAVARGFELSDEVVRYLIHHASRDMSDLVELLERLDRASLSAKRKVTIPFIKQVMGW
ncbi:DnaA regulatory inactivator Hda [Marinobacterium arenosum]|uniref:DnaA regulatory inactivator Hda n=1 Tax=Marinobacterium arenosum TaxID=2862496 RepID=UPI001C967F6A|nr:DnaA regulatory inactivator Hda [Marinobacterium arenosum]MBY4677907.1 DnaA regulatory inactivator Hda [Marinobacterium arenosum]